MERAMDPLKFKRIQKRIEESKAKEEKRLQKKAFEKAKDVSSLLKQKYEVKKVWVYGSVVQGGFHKRSDIDILIDNHTGSFWEMYVEAEKNASPFPISIITEGEAFPSLIESVKREGVEL